MNEPNEEIHPPFLLCFVPNVRFRTMCVPHFSSNGSLANQITKFQIHEQKISYEKKIRTKK